MLLEAGADAADATTRQLIEDNLGGGFDLAAFAAAARRRPVKQRLFAAAETDDASALKRLALAAEGGGKLDWNADNGSMTLLQLATTRGSHRAAAFLLDAGCDPNGVCAGERRAPVLIAAHHGSHRMLDVFKRCKAADFSAVEAVSGKTVLHEVFRADSAKAGGLMGVPADEDEVSYAKCIKVLLSKSYSSNPGFEEQINRIINYQVIGTHP